MRRVVSISHSLCGALSRASLLAVLLLYGAVALDPMIPGVLISGAEAQDEKPKKDKREIRCEIQRKDGIRKRGLQSNKDTQPSHVLVSRQDRIRGGSKAC